MKEYRKFKTYKNRALALGIVELLEQNDIKAQLKEVSSNLSATFGGGQSTLEYEVKLINTDFERAQQILDQNVENQLEQVDKDHYLFQFTTEELYDVLFKSDEWNELDVSLAKKILQDRGESVTEETLQLLREERVEELTKPDKGSLGWIVTGYISSVLGGLLGILLGWYIWKSTKVLPNGEKVPSFSHKDQKHGMNMFLIGVLSLIIYLGSYIYLKLILGAQFD